jgi:hypothetical protein
MDNESKVEYVIKTFPLVSRQKQEYLSVIARTMLDIQTMDDSPASGDRVKGRVDGAPKPAWPGGA